MPSLGICALSDRQHSAALTRWLRQRIGPGAGISEEKPGRMRWATLSLLLALRLAKQVWSSGELVQILQPHNETRCLMEGRNASACAAFSAFNFSTCLSTHFRYPALPRLPTAHASCLLASGCNLANGKG